MCQPLIQHYSCYLVAKVSYNYCSEAPSTTTPCSKFADNYEELPHKEEGYFDCERRANDPLFGGYNREAVCGRVETEDEKERFQKQLDQEMWNALVWTWFKELFRF
jgi:hypothetical protein